MNYRKSEIHRAEVYRSLGYACAAFSGAFFINIYLAVFILNKVFFIRLLAALAFLAFANYLIDVSYNVLLDEEERINGNTHRERNI